MRAAFDNVIPGYADAWNDAKMSVPVNRRIYRWGGRRKYLRLDERCLLLYKATQAIDLHESFGVASDPDTMVIENRGYVSLMVVRFADWPASAKALYAMRDPGVELNDRRHAKSRGQPYEPKMDEFWWTDDGTDFNERCRITLRVLHYIHENSTEIVPVWERHSPEHLIHES